MCKKSFDAFENPLGKLGVRLWFNMAKCGRFEGDMFMWNSLTWENSRALYCELQAHQCFTNVSWPQRKILLAPLNPYDRCLSSVNKRSPEDVHPKPLILSLHPETQHVADTVTSLLTQTSKTMGLKRGGAPATALSHKYSIWGCVYVTFRAVQEGSAPGYSPSSVKLEQV